MIFLTYSYTVLLLLFNKYRQHIFNLPSIHVFGFTNFSFYCNNINYLSLNKLKIFLPQFFYFKSMLFLKCRKNKVTTPPHQI